MRRCGARKSGREVNAMKPNMAVQEEASNRLTWPELQKCQDMMDLEALLVKKCRAYAEQTTDENARKLCEDQANVHERHYNMLLALVEGNSNDITKSAKLIMDT
jgi:hypothetical protein